MPLPLLKFLKVPLLKSTSTASPRRSGFAYGFGAHVVWGILPLFFLSLAPAGAWEIVAWRVVFSVALCAILLTVTHAWHGFAAIWRDRRLRAAFVVAALLIYGNWQTYVLAATSGHVVDSALGYFINPVFTVLLGVFVLHERLRPMQWVSVALSTIAIVIITVDEGQVPWIALILAGTFGVYGLVKNRVGVSTDALTGLAVETTALFPIAIVVLVVVQLTGGITFAAHGVGHALMLMLAGPMTTVPLILFAAAARRLPLTWTGFLQYASPTIQFLIGVLVLHEAMPVSRWVGFMIVWAGLALLIADSAVAAGRRHRAPAGEVRVRTR